MDATKVVTSVFVMLVTFGVLYQVVKNPTGANGLLGAGASTISGLTKAIEGR